MKLLKEPLLHFLALGALLFAIHAVLDRTDETDAGPSRIIEVGAADLEWLKEMWARQWRRAPTDEELRGIVADHVREEILSREARELQLDVNDTVVRRRLAQKMAFLLEDTIRTAEPPETELRLLYDTSPQLVGTPSRVSFIQVFFKRGQAQNRAAGEARAVLATLSDAAGDPARYGDRLLLGDTFVGEDERSLTNIFGASFAQAVLSLPADRWNGPIESNFGLHLVKVTGFQEAQPRSFAEVRGQLAEEWYRRKREGANARLYADLMQKYQVVPDPAARAFLTPLLTQKEARR